MERLSRDIIRPRDPEFKEIPSQIVNDTKYMPHFKECIGAIDGTHVDVIIHQNRIICAAFALHNYIRLSKALDPTFRVIDANPNFIPPEAFSDVECISIQEVKLMSTNEMTKVRNDITTSLMVARRQRRVS
ncbi:hypothetical protein PVK06_039282 [Gossypium arboreum]|uniref:Nuclease HARBI1 n=1 Tax=Gossypium arboreum TaxID=29729 RepID=A0ABR0N375_GOSAR|nr:hypothetical protein PVK06_039282 [Gossypium arboreum]